MGRAFGPWIGGVVKGVGVAKNGAAKGRVANSVLAGTVDGVGGG
jgi:hypothetical protein